MICNGFLDRPKKIYKLRKQNRVPKKQPHWTATVRRKGAQNEWSNWKLLLNHYIRASEIQLSLRWFGLFGKLFVQNDLEQEKMPTMAISLGSVHLSLLLTNETTSANANEDTVTHENDDRIYLKLWRNCMRTMCPDALNKKHNNINLAPTLLLRCSSRNRTMRKMNETKLRERNRVCVCAICKSSIETWARWHRSHNVKFVIVLSSIFCNGFFRCSAIIIFFRLASGRVHWIR